MDLLKDYDCEIKYHPGSSNPVYDSLSHKVYLNVRVPSVLSEPALYTRIREAHVAYPKTQKLARLDQEGNTFGFHFHADGLLCLSGRVVVLDDATLREDILSQAHRIKFSVHPGSMKM
ncbi:uncharacterized protein [Henckelia pumila]|uniref:uncharacterized protein n=1 Tax=Henckelia pumila TaxID=405737 RepID=UPI003C6E8AC6